MINGINPSSYNDYPGEVSYVIFLGGCNFKCPFCHNSSIVMKKTKTIELDHVINSLKQRKKFLHAVVITGGEPTIYGDELIELIIAIKQLGFKIKLDTNGTNPSLLKKIITNKLVDYIAMDIKNTFDKYQETAGCKINIDNIKESISIIENSNVKYEFRTTINKKNHNFDDIDEIKTYFKREGKYSIQNYRYSKEQIKGIDFGSFSDEELNEIKKDKKISVVMV